MTGFLSGIDSIVVFRNCHDKVGRGTLIHVSRTTLIFEIYNPFSILQLSEVLKSVHIVRGDRVVYRGRAVVSHIEMAGLLEVKMGTPLKTVIDEMGGGTRYPVKAFQIGGPLGGLVPASRIDDLTLDFESFAGEGFLLGHAGVVSVPDDFPVIKLIEHLFEFTRKESCGKCFPCRLGSARGHELVSGAAEHGRIIDRQLFDDLLEAMELGSLCALGSGLPLPVRNALQYFEEELKDYFTATKES